MSLGIDIVLAITSSVIGITGIVKAVSEFLQSKKGKSSIKISISEGNRIEIPGNTSPEEIEKLIEKLQQIDNIEVELKKDALNNEKGFILSEVFLYLVPGIIALLFSGTFIYLIVNHQDKPNYTTPKELSSAMTMIIGYFFGVGAAAASNKGKTLTPDEIKKLTSQ